MTLPDGFNEWEHLQSTLMRVMNPLVRKSFRDDVLDNDINTPESALKYACTLRDNDTSVMTNLRMMLFLFVRGDNELFDNLYGIPLHEYHRDVRFEPQILFKFKESKEDAKIHNRQTKPCRMRISFRIPKCNDSLITPAMITLWRNRLNTVFPSTYSHTVGIDSCVYEDLVHDFKIVCRYQQRTGGITLIQKMVDYMNYVWDNSPSTVKDLTYQAPNLKYNVKESKKVQETVRLTGLNETYKLPTGFVGAKVWLYRVELHIHGRLRNETLLYRVV